MSTTTALDLLERVDARQKRVVRMLDSERRVGLGQYMTPPSVARLMAARFDPPRGPVRLLDAGAGAGALIAAWVDRLVREDPRPPALHVTAYEVDPSLIAPLRTTLRECATACARAGLPFTHDLVTEDFILHAVERLARAPPGERFTAAILNPPYAKIRSNSAHRRALHTVGIETSNLYSAFLALAVDLLETGGELVAITPRSFCNGPYFLPFRERLLARMQLRHVHIYESRAEAFRDDGVLQENVVLHAVKQAQRGATVRMTSSRDPTRAADVPYDDVVRPDDPARFIRILVDSARHSAGQRVRAMPATLADLGLHVSTGAVVDFRQRSFLRPAGQPHTVPLIHPAHLAGCHVVWPGTTRKPTAIQVSMETLRWLMPAGIYVLTKRFTAKEEPRRVVAAVCDSAPLQAAWIGFENHVNVFHADGAGVEATLARGLCAYLNSTLVDAWLREFSGHTQVNAADLRALRYPAREALERLGGAMGNSPPSQAQLDALVEQALGA